MIYKNRVIFSNFLGKRRQCPNHTKNEKEIYVLFNDNISEQCKKDNRAENHNLYFS